MNEGIDGVFRGAQRHIDSFTKKPNPGTKETKQFLKSLSESVRSLVKAERKELSRMEVRHQRALAQSIHRATIVHVVEHNPEALQALEALWKRLRSMKTKFSSLNKVASIEETDFLDSTEKDLEQFIAELKKRSLSKKELYLIQMIKRIGRRIEQLKLVAHLEQPIKLAKKPMKKKYKKLLSLIDIFYEDDLKDHITSIGVNSKDGNLHLRFWRALKRFRQEILLIEEMLH